MQIHKLAQQLVPNRQPAFGLLAWLTALLIATSSAHAASGTWTNLMANGAASGSWAVASNWLNGVIAGDTDSTADFSTLNPTNATIVTLDGNRTNGLVLIADTLPDTNWTFNAGTPSTSSLMLLTSAGSPVIHVSNQLATFGAPIFSVNGFIKSGAGTLRMNNSNTNATGWLNGLITVSNGIMQCGNGSIGIAGNQNGTNRVVVLDGATVEVISAIGVNNKHLTISGNGVGGTKGALYAFPPTNNANGTRWGLSSVNDSGVSANSSASFPAITLASNVTVNVDGVNWTYVFLMGYTTSTTNNFTLTKTGLGRIAFDRGANVSNIVVNAGSVSPNSASAFGAVQSWTVNNGGAIYTWQNNCYNAGSAMTVNAGGVWDLNGRNDSAGTGYTETIGFLAGTGTITHGLNGANVATVLAVNNNSSFSGPVQVANGILHLTKNTVDTTLQLNGTNNYNGNTTVNAGTLIVDGRHTGGSNYVVAAGATLAGRGTILQNAGNTITLNGTLLAGDNGGTLTVVNVVGGGDVIVSNANLTTLGQLNNSGSGYFNSLYLTNSTVTALLQQNGTEASIYASTVNVDGTNTLAFTSANPATGQFPFIKYGSLGGLDGFAGLKLSVAAGFAASLSNNVANASIDIVITAVPALVWRGTPTGDWTIGGSANWLNGVTPSAYTETAGLGAFVIFDDSAAGTAAVNVVANVTPKGITVTSSSKNYLWSGVGAVSTAGSVVKDGSSTLTIANTNALAGTITILNGALAIGNGGASGSLGAAPVVNSGQVVFNRSDDVSIANSISGSGSLVKSNANIVTLTGVGNIGGSIAANAGTLALGPSGTITVSGDVTGGGTFGINSAGKVILTSGTITYTGGSLIAGGGTLEFDSVFPPSGSITDNGTLALGVGGTFSDNITGTGGLTLLNGASVALTGANTYTGPTRVLGGGTLTADAANYPSASVLILGSTNGAADVGAATFNAGNPVLGGLAAGGNLISTTADPITMGGSGQTLIINGNVSVGNVSPAGAQVSIPVTGSGVSVVVNTNGGVIQLGLGAAGSGVNPDSVLVDFSAVDNFTANLGTNGVLNLGTVDGNPGPPAGATVLNQFLLAAVSNSITAGQINVGAGGRQLVPELVLGAGTNVLRVTTLSAGFGGRDGSYIHFGGGTGGLRLRGYDGVARAAFLVGNNPASGTGASITNTVDFTGHPVDLLLSALNIGNYNNAGFYQNTFSFDTGVLDATSTALSLIRNNNLNAAESGSTLNIGGGTASLGPVNLTASAAYGTLNITGGSVSVANITSPGAGVATLNIANATLNLALTNSGNPVTAPVAVDSLTLDTAVNFSVTAPSLTVGQFALMTYTGSLGGTGYSALTLTSLPAGVGGYLSNNVAALSIDLVVTNAPVVINPNAPFLQVSVSGNTLSLGWPTNLGWILQSNSVGLVANSSWFPYPADGSVGVTNANITINPAKTNVFFRMVKP